MRVTYLGFAVDHKFILDILKVDAMMPIQTHKFAWNLIDALKIAGCNVSFISSAPVSNYPANPKILFKASLVSVLGASGLYLPFVNLIILKHISRLISLLLFGGVFIFKARPDFLVVHGVHSPYIISAYFFEKLFKLKSVVIITDPPEAMLGKSSGFKGLLMTLDKFMVSWLLTKISGVVVLSKDLATALCPEVPALLIQGFASEDSMSDPKYKHSFGRVGEAFHIVYAGGLSAEYGVDLVLNAISLIQDDDFRFHFFGKGPMHSEIMSRAQLDSRIRCHGFLAPSDLLPMLKGADLLINPRPTTQQLVNLTFPSKLFEYVSLGVPVLTTRLPNFPAELIGNVNFIDDESAIGLARDLNVMKSFDSAVLKRRASIAKDIVLTSFGLQAQGNKIKNFFNSL